MNIFSKIFRRSMESTPSNMEEGDAKELHEPTTQVNRMKIPDSIGEAIRYIVEERGITFIKERGFINMLDDLHVLKSIPASKNILRNLQSDSAYLEKLLLSPNWELDALNVTHQYAAVYGFREDLVHYIVQCIGYGIGHLDKLPQFIERTTVKDASPDNCKTGIEATSEIGEYDPKGELPDYRIPSVECLFEDAHNDSFLNIYDVIKSPLFLASAYTLPVLLGVDETMEPVIRDLTQLQHILMAGTTSKGKSVAQHVIISSLLYKQHPSEVSLALADTKGLEYNYYNDLYDKFIIKPFDFDDNISVANSIEQTYQLLQGLVLEVNRRNQLFQKARVRDIKCYNKLFVSRKLNPAEGFAFLRRIVVFVDDIGTLMLHDAKRTEQLIIGINQSGANCGIHLIVSTQLITKEVVTPTIRVQFPTRIAFSLLSTSESRLLIGNGEANKIFESGDCILMNNGHQQKIHCPFISDIQILNTINEIRKQEGRYIPDYLPSEEDTYINNVMENKDPLLKDVARLIVQEQTCSITYVQRRFNIGYNRSMRIIGQLEKIGIVYSGDSIHKNVLIHTMADLERILLAY